MYKVSNEIKGIIKLNDSGNWVLVADCSGLTNYQIENLVKELNK